MFFFLSNLVIEILDPDPQSDPDLMNPIHNTDSNPSFPFVCGRVDEPTASSPGPNPVSAPHPLLSPRLPCE